MLFNSLIMYENLLKTELNYVIMYVIKSMRVKVFMQFIYASFIYLIYMCMQRICVYMYRSQKCTCLLIYFYRFNTTRESNSGYKGYRIWVIFFFLIESSNRYFTFNIFFSRFFTHSVILTLINKK